MSTPYGTDLFLVIGSDGSMDVDPTMREVSGLQTLVQSLVMRQFTPTGSVIGSPDDCVDVRQWLSKGMTASEAQQLGAVVQAQLLRDPRVKSAQVSAIYNSASNSITLTENITGGAGPFKLVISVSNLTVSILLNGVPLGGGSGSLTPAPAPAPVSTPATAAGIAGPPGPPGPATPGPAGPTGPTGAPGGNLAIIVPFGPANAASTALVPAGAVITAVGVLVTAAFTGGLGPTVQVTVNGVVVFPTPNANLAAPGAYWSFPIATVASSANVQVVFGGSATSGAGTAILQYNVTET